jgi:hypothetical protein
MNAKRRYRRRRRRWLARERLWLRTLSCPAAHAFIRTLQKPVLERHLDEPLFPGLLYPPQR